ncbi:thermonuclease family protein [Methylorubrum populi]|uniref:Succinoglycan biosynthesis protein n=1 Tax=Methylorubrum populi TaxID=223967 RepID=A0A833J7A5_9HYPH|nr:thermonuclease family protein [Methylorubrum populi]KAB7786013.1 Succinoglycan biosynthesis protein [Methylorubrum populi]
MTKALSVAIVAIIALGVGTVQAEALTGRASVIDGDTLDIQGQRIRLHGIDAPESGQACQDVRRREFRCGQKAALALSDKIGRDAVVCERKDTDKYGRTVAVCRLGAVDLNGWLVEQGLALAYRRYSEAYVPQEDSAKGAKRGIWTGAFTAPWEWRKGERTMDMGMAAPGGPDGSIPSPKSPAAAATSTCAIKGNISRSGNRIYHLPGTRDYERTQINEASGERMFCSEDEAKAAGWRAPRG